MLELLAEEVRSEAVSTFTKRLIERRKPLFSVPALSCSLLLFADPAA